jgi:hypothetical protein
MADKKKQYTIEEKLKFKIPYQWKIQTFVDTIKGPKAQCVAYVDARDVMDLLDKAVGFENWRDEYKFEAGQWLCGLSIKLGEEWVTKWDTGVSGDFEKEKSAISDAFKRAGVKWGIGRFLYDLEIKWVDVKDKKPVDPNGKRIYDLTEYFRKER